MSDQREICWRMNEHFHERLIEGDIRFLSPFIPCGEQ